MVARCDMRRTVPCGRCIATAQALATDPDIEAAVAGAVAEAVAAARRRPPDVLFVFASAAYGADAARAGPLAFDEAAPRALAGAVGRHGVIGAGRELETRAGGVGAGGVAPRRGRRGVPRASPTSAACRDVADRRD